MNSHISRVSCIALIGAAYLLQPTTPVYGVADSSWQLAPPTTGNWFDASNWTSGVPTSSSGQNAFIDNGGTSLISASGANWYWLHVGNNASGKLMQSAGTSSGTYLSIGFNAGSSGSFAMQGGT